MSALLNLPGTGAKNKGYVSLDAPIKEHTVSAGGIAQQPIELGDLANDAFFDEVARIRDGIRTLEASLDTLQTKQQYSLQSHSEALSLELASLSSQLSASLTSYRARIAALGADVEGEARRAHWDGLKKALQRAGEKWQRVERAQRDRVREKIGRQTRIVNPDATDAEIQQAFETSGGSGQPQIFQQALAGSRTAAATAALNKAQSRRSELVQIEETLVELAAIMQQVADLVVTQDVKFTTLESTSAAVEADLEQGAKQVTLAKASAAAARHKRKLCAAFGLVLLIVLIVVISVEVRGATGRGGETKTETVAASGTETKAAETAVQTATAAVAAVTSAARRRV
ncbi:Plasma membrane t-SNARE, secretory vesicle fusion [Rhodotorula kratochvilovae]